MFVSFESDNLIYNRYDLIYSNYEEMIYESKERKYRLMYHQENKNAYINLWDKELPQEVFECVVKDVFAEKDINRISFLRCKNNYNNLLEKTNDIKICLPESTENLLNCLKAKSRNTLKRKKRILIERLGELTTKHYRRDSIPTDIVSTYFDWKRRSHGIEYGMQEEEYLNIYHVTDAFVVKTGKQIVGISFYCVVNEIAYFENSSYNQEYKELSIGAITYELMLEELIRQKIKIIYLGGGDYDYKRKFGAIETTAYSGHIYSKEVLMLSNAFLKDNCIKNVVIYGLGKYGNEFIRLVNTKSIDVNIIGAVDKNRKEIANINTYTLDDDFPEADTAIITLKNRNNDVEELLNKKYKIVIYMNDLLGV